MADLQKHLEKAEKNANKGKFDAALEEYKAAFALAPQNPEVLQPLCDLSARVGRTSEALEYYGRLFDLYAEKMDAQRAVPVFRKHLQSAPNPPERWLKLGQMLERARKPEEAAEAYREALGPFRQRGHAAGVLEAARRLAGIETDRADTQVLFAEEAAKAGQADSAGKAFLRAGQLLAAEKPDRALELLRRAHELAPDRSTTLCLAQAVAARGEFGPAAELLLPLYAESEQDPAVLDTLSTALLKENRLAEAEEVIEAFYQAKPDTYEKAFRLISAYCRNDQGQRAVALLGRLRERLVAAKRQRAFVDKLNEIFKQHPANLPLLEFAARAFNELNQESRYAEVLDRLFECYSRAQNYERATDALERLIDIDPYDFNNSKRLERLQGKIPDSRFRAVGARISAGVTVGGQAPALAPAEKKTEEVSAADPQQRQALLDDLIVQVEIFLQYSLKGKAIEKLQKIHEAFAGEETRNERLRKLFEQAEYFPEGFGAATSETGALPPTGAAAGVPAPGGSAESVNDLAKIAQISHAIYRQGTPKSVLHAAVSELGKYLEASRCLGALGRPGAPPSMAVEYCAPGVPQSPGSAVARLLQLVGQRDLDPQNGAVLDANLTPELRQVGSQSVLAMPLIGKEKQEPVGLLVLSQADRARAWKPNEVYLLRAVADQAETAISHTKLRSLMKSLSVADASTGLLSRSSYLNCLVSEVTRAKSQGTPLVVALLELDKGASFLRQIGEPVMEKFMRQAGETVLGSIRQNDLAVRYTATSLAVVLSDATAENVHSSVNKLRQQLAALKLPAGRDSITFSAGLSEALIRPDYDPLDIVTELINRAELSLEEARKQGDAVAVK